MTESRAQPCDDRPVSTRDRHAGQGPGQAGAGAGKSSSPGSAARYDALLPRIVAQMVGPGDATD